MRWLFGNWITLHTLLLCPRQADSDLGQGETVVAVENVGGSTTGCRHKFGQYDGHGMAVSIIIERCL